MRSPALALAITAVLLACACDDAQPKTQPKATQDTPSELSKQDSPPAAEPPLGPPVLSVATAKISEKDSPEHGIMLAADGTVTVMGNKVGHISVDGKLSSAAGQVMMIVDAAGKISSPDGKALPLHLTATGAAIDGPDGQSMVIEFAEDGSVTLTARNQAGDAVPLPEGKAPPPAMVSEGCAGEMAKTCGLAFAAYTMMVGAGARGPAPAPAPAPSAP